MKKKKTKEADNEFMKVLQEIVDTMNDVIVSKKSEELELTLGDENMGDALVIQIHYVPNTNNSKNNNTSLN